MLVLLLACGQQTDNSALVARIDALESELAATRDELEALRADALTPEALAPFATTAWVEEQDYVPGLGAYLAVGDQRLTITGANLHLQSGSGSTDDDGPPIGLGNLVIGYAEDRLGSATRTGSHNLVIGPDHSWTGTGGIVAGAGNAISGQGAAVLGGEANSASGEGAVVVGGAHNEAADYATAILGGDENRTSAWYATVAGGYGNAATGTRSTVSGGVNNTATGDWSAVAGGQLNLAEGNGSAVAGGLGNTAAGFCAAVLGGYDNRVSGLASTVTGTSGLSSEEDYSVAP